MKKYNPLFNDARLVNGNFILNTFNPKEEVYRAIVENTVHAFFLTLSNGTILETNLAATKIFGYTAEEFRYLNRWDFIVPDDHLLRALQHSEHPGLANTEATGIKKNGEKFPIEVSSSFFTDVDGNRKRSTMITDISLRKQAEASMRLSKERYDLVVKATKDLVWDWDLVTGEIYRSGNNLADVYGHSSNDSIKNIESWEEYLHPDDKNRIVKQIDHYINSKEETAFNFEYRFRREDGSYVFINDKGYIIRNAAGKVIRMIGAAEDITERKESAIAIEESEQRYKMFVQNSTEGIWRIDLKKNIPVNASLEEMIEQCFSNAFIAECNDAYAQMYGFQKASELIGIPLNKLWPGENPVSVSYITDFFKHGFKATEKISHEYNRNGEEVIFINTMIGIVQSDFLVSVWGIRRSITEQIKAEKALAESENRLRTIVNTDPECIKLLDKNGCILEMNPAGLKMIGADNFEQVQGKNALDILLPEYREGFMELIQSVFAGESGKFTFEIKGFKGKKLWLETHCVPLKNSAGEIISLLSVTRDITANKKAQAQLLASEEQYRYLFNNNPASIIIWDFETLEIIEVNDTAVELYGYSKKEFLQFKITDLSKKEIAGKPVVSPNNQDKTDMSADSWKHVSKSGEVIIMDITSHKIKYNGREAVLALGNNITEKIQLEKSLNEERRIKNQQITEAVITGQEKERTELGEELHDNINQILASTKLYIECALKDKEPRIDLITESKTLIEKAMVEIRNLSKSLLPPSLGEVGLQQALFEMAENIRQVNALQISVEWNNIDENKLCSKLRLTVFHIVQEQMNNIIKHANAKFVLITLKIAHNILHVSIKDDGCGFDTTQKRNGVGLRNIASRAEVNNGMFIIDSKPGAGCELIINFALTNLFHHLEN